MRRSLPVLMMCALALAGCKAKEALDKAAIAASLDKKGALDVVKEASKDKYDPPADGRLTEGQVQMYLKVRDHEKQIAQVAKAEIQQHSEAAKKAGENSVSGMMEGVKSLGSVSDFFTADIRAAKELGYNTAEYQWVKAQILAASSSVLTQKIAEAGNAQMDAMYQQTKKQYDEAKDDQTKKVLADTLAQFDKQRSEMQASQQKEDPAVTYNRQLLSKYENALNAFTSELSKYDNKDGEAKANMEKFQQDLDKQKETGKQ